MLLRGGRPAERVPRREVKAPGLVCTMLGVVLTMVGVGRATTGDVRAVPWRLEAEEVGGVVGTVRVSWVGGGVIGATSLGLLVEGRL